jgi:hypothetical protein
MLKNKLLSLYCFSESLGGVNGQNITHVKKTVTGNIIQLYAFSNYTYYIICFNITQHKVFNSVIKPLKLLCSTAQNKNYTTKVSHKQNGTHTGNYRVLLITQVL